MVKSVWIKIKNINKEMHGENHSQIDQSHLDEPQPAEVVKNAIFHYRQKSQPLVIHALLLFLRFAEAWSF